MYTPGTIANLHRTPTKINKNGAIVKIRILVEQVIQKAFKGSWNNCLYNASFRYPMLMVFWLSADIFREIF